MKYIILTCLFFAALSSKAQTIQGADSTDWVKHILNDSFKVTYDKNTVPKIILDSVLKNELEAFRSGVITPDMMNWDKPPRQIIFIAHSGLYWIVAYHKTPASLDQCVFIKM